VARFTNLECAAATAVRVKRVGKMDPEIRLNSVAIANYATCLGVVGKMKAVWEGEVPRLANQSSSHSSSHPSVISSGEEKEGVK